MVYQQQNPAAGNHGAVSHEGFSRAFWEAIILATYWGFEVLPLSPRDGKGPHPGLGRTQEGKGGVYHATNDPDQLNRWWEQWPNANAGARVPHWAVVLDVDNKEGGLDNWESLNEGHTLPPTFTTGSGGGGYHYWYRLPHAGKLNRYAAPGIDVRHHGNYLVMPGSLHHGTSHYYEVEHWEPPTQWPVLPAHLHKHVFEPPKANTPRRPFRRAPLGPGARNRLAENLIEKMATAAAGTRNDTLNSTVFQAVTRGLDILDDLHAAAQDVGLDDREIESTMRSAITGAERERESAA